MARLPSRTYSEAAVLSTLESYKKGAKEAVGEFVWQHVDRFYCIAFVGTLDPQAAEEITVESFKRILSQLKQKNLKEFSQGGLWDWLSSYVVRVIAEYHEQNRTSPSQSITDPNTDGSSQMDWETTVILGPQRVKRCIRDLPQEQKRVFILRHQLNLNFESVATVLNEHSENVMAWLHRARVQIVKCLGRG